MSVVRFATTSLSARRAWIEIGHGNWCRVPYEVALRKESVDRNWQDIDERETISAVALRKESVDRNLMTAGDVTAPSSRSPQGERG